MTQVELMENLAAFLKNVVLEYESQQSDGTYSPINVYPGYLPVKTNAKESESCMYVLVLECEDGEEQSAAKVEIGFSIVDGDTAEGWRSLFNLMEHVRQALLKNALLLISIGSSCLSNLRWQMSSLSRSGRA